MPKNWRIRHRVNSLRDPVMQAGVKFFSMSGKPTILKKGYVLSASQGSYTLTGQDASLSTAEGSDSRAGDEAFLDAFSSSVTGLDASWNTPNSLSSPPTGVTVATINSELRITEIDLRSTVTGMGLLGGSLDIPEWENLKQCTLINTAINAFDTQYPSAIHKIGSKLEYLYIAYSDHALITDGGATAEMPHEIAVNNYSGIKYSHPGKHSGNERNNIHGSVPDDIDNLSGLKYFHLNYTDLWNQTGFLIEPDVVNGIQDVSQNIWNITTLESVSIYENWNIEASGNTFSFPSTITHIPNLAFIYFSGGGGSLWQSDEQGFMTGGYPSDLGSLTNIKAFWVAKNSVLTGFPDLRGSTGLIHISIGETRMGGQVPSWLFDGRFPDLDILGMRAPTGDNMTGNLPPFGDYPKLDLISIDNHAFTGAVPTGIWDNDIKKLNIGGNNFTSLGTTDFTNLRFTQNLVFFRNDIEGEQTPYLDWFRLDNIDPDDFARDEYLRDQLNRVWFDDNRYVPRDFLYVPPNAPSGETNIELFRQLASQGVSVGMFPQKSAGQSATYEITAGANITIDDFDGTYSHAGNTYQWEKDGSAISGATNKNLSLTNVQVSDSGNYVLKVSNPDIPEHTFTSATITLIIE